MCTAPSLSMIVFVALLLFYMALASNSLQSQIQAVLAAHQSGRLQEAIVGYEQLLLKFPSDSIQAKTAKSSLHGNAGAIYLSQGNYDLALKHFESSVGLTPENPSARYNLAVILTSKFNNHAAALKHCALAIKYDQESHRLYHLMGNIMQGLGKEADAERYYLMAESIAKQQQEEEETPSSATSSSLENSFSVKQFIEYHTQRANSDQIIHTITCDNNDYTIRYLSINPIILEIDRLLTNEECEIIQQQAIDKLEKSFIMGNEVKTVKSETDDITGVADETIKNPNQKDSRSAYRSSENAWLPRIELLYRIQQRISTILNLPLSYILHHSEDLQVVRYQTGDQFKAHQDASAFNPRLITALIYLNSIVETTGGETWFPFAHAQEEDLTHRHYEKQLLKQPESVEEAILQALQIYDDDDNNHSLVGSSHDTLPGMKIKPRMGKAIIFFNFDTQGSVNPLAVHAGLPTMVQNGQHAEEKWIANYWIQSPGK
jgi:hypothetical protein